jgi:hypothetical protein
MLNWTHDAVRTDPMDCMTPFEQDQAQEREEEEKHFRNCMESIVNEAQSENPDFGEMVYSLVMAAPGKPENTESKIERIKAILEEK